MRPNSSQVVATSGGPWRTIPSTSHICLFFVFYFFADRTLNWLLILFLLLLKRNFHFAPNIKHTLGGGWLGSEEDEGRVLRWP